MLHKNLGITTSYEKYTFILRFAIDYFYQCQGYLRFNFVLVRTHCFLRAGFGVILLVMSRPWYTCRNIMQNITRVYCHY